LANRKLTPHSITVASLIFYALGISEVMGGVLLLLTPAEGKIGFGVLTVLLGFVDIVGGYGLWRRQMFLGLILCIAGIFSEGVEMIFIPLLMGVNIFAFAYAYSAIVGYVVILVLLMKNWRTLLENI